MSTSAIALASTNANSRDLQIELSEQLGDAPSLYKEFLSRSRRLRLRATLCSAACDRGR
jgi:hypothetical protein